jgi:ketohexokinase
VVCAWGSAGAAAYRNEQLYVSASFPPEKIIDTLGAGDTFNAAFICCQVKQMDVAQSLQTACRVAGYKIGSKGFKNIRSLSNVFQ